MDESLKCTRLIDEYQRNAFSPEPTIAILALIAMTNSWLL
jgi:hypothetical protein